MFFFIIASLWSNWANANKNGRANPIRSCAKGFYVTSMQWKEQHHYGLVDLKFGCSDQLFHIMTGNKYGDWNTLLTCGEGFDQTTAHEQDGYGIVDVAVSCVDSSAFKRSNNNLNGQENTIQSCPSGTKITGFKTQEQDHFGIINYRFVCN
jgi:hypothetical protein